MKQRSWTELRKSGTSWASWRTGRVLGGVFGGWARWTGSGWLRVVGGIRCGAGLVRLSLASVGNVPSSWSRFLTEGARMANYSGGFQNIFPKETQNSIRKQRKKPKDITWAFSKEALIGTRPRRQSNLRTLKIDPNMVDLREKAKQTATVTSERTSKDALINISSFLEPKQTDHDGGGAKASFRIGEEDKGIAHVEDRFLRKLMKEKKEVMHFTGQAYLFILEVSGEGSK
ncbi:hypothetical protein DY000_02025156 [Brassica cretica]|uniref:Uncharacterized protein n=1 Tax=Brassica cretica TaxID=69181 RepID=A0ABQ7E261_BRACR|nr:hypothetical protein DY000_02025156 [Brassica cretica]